MNPQSSGAGKGNRSFNDCPFKIQLPTVSEVADDHFDLKIVLTRKKLSASGETSGEVLVLSGISFQDMLKRKYAFKIKRKVLLAEKSVLSASLTVPIARNKIMFRDASMQVVFLSPHKKYELSYTFNSQRESRLENVYVADADEDDISRFREILLDYEKYIKGIKSEPIGPGPGPGPDGGGHPYTIPALKEYRNAVFREMYFLKDNGGRKYKVTDGRYIDQNNGYYSYVFELDSELHLADDAPITISVPGKSASGVVIVCEGFQIIIVIDKDLGNRVSSAMISVEPWKLLEALGGRLDSFDKNSRIAIELAEKGPHLATKESGTAIPKGQDNALQHVADHDITVIWGPPGTGKTYAMSVIALKAMKRGKRVLIVSHSNISVDGVIKATADRLKENGMMAELKQGKILRYGYVRDEELSADSDIVAFNYALERLSDEKRRMEELKREKAKLSDADYASVRRKNIENELHRIRNKVREKEKEYAGRAQILATTISKVLIDSIFDGRRYDLVMFDEVSMAYVPQLIVAASYAKEKFVCVGDFRQLAPIAQSESRKVLCTDIFTYLGINQYGKIHAHPWLVMLNEQRRMHPSISAFPNRYVYEKLLVDHPNTIHERDDIAARKPIPASAMQLINLAGTFCAASKNVDNSRFNILSAIISFGTALQSKKNGETSVGIISPYAAQARLIRAMLQDYSERDKTTISCATVHQFQGSERNVIIFDAVESYPAAKAGILLSSNENSAVTRLINVAITRARGKFITVANAKFWEMKFKGMNHIYYDLLRYLQDQHMVTQNDKNNSLLAYIDSLEYGKKIRRFSDQKKIIEVLQKDIEGARDRIIVSLPDGERKSNSLVLKLLKKEKSNGIHVMCKALNYKALPDDWKEITWASENAAFPLISIDDNIVWYGVPDFKGKFTDGDWGFFAVLPLVYRITGKHTVNMINSLCDIEYKELDGVRSLLTEKPSSGTRPIGGGGGTGPSPEPNGGISEYIKKYVKCSKCGKPTALAIGYKSGKTYLKCPSCGNMDYLTKDEINEYIDRYGITCPKHHCSIYGGLGKYGVYVRCEMGHYLKPYEI